MSLRRAISAVLSGTLVISLMSSVSAKSGPFRYVANSEMKIALTFDDGPHKRYTEEILGILDEFGIKATFFVIGRNCEENPKAVQHIIERGHEIGNHTYSHPHLSKITAEELTEEINRTEKLLLECFNYRPRLFRPPEGIYSSEIAGALQKLDYLPVLWTVDTADWRRPTSKEIAENVIDNISAGRIILCHDYVSGESSTPEALKSFIPELLSRGYVFVTVSELIESARE